ncbi:MAG: hypothetical protein HWD61_04590 [Parachlamydiaceae bacterium]|nr:MAG: hypothetical protein HWD61_04590 [Parachlamydiaceae bacterium]
MQRLNAKIQSSADFQEELRDQKLEVIADLFQKLEWLNPFQHHQGKTDLILLSKLLCEEGFNPPIIPLAYTSSWTQLTDWKNYLKRNKTMAGRAKPISKKKKKLGAFPISQRPIFLL